ncbi:MAG: hypothetical protein NC251_00960 [Lachnoclostridium sp.]|nr:hypothetical protein [Lachnospira sp.]MCM1246986.1 hypothetical protein [Lachnoclostridium sp.]MCM1535039.1 hypothetical protein [Clostridium sp.]
MIKKLTVIKQFIYNVISTTLPTLVLQLLILPLIAQKMDGDAYGLVLAIVASVMMIAAGIGNTLNNIHMISDREYREKNIFGDFGILFIISTFVVSFITLGILKYYDVREASIYLLTIIMSILVLAKEYYIVRFWIDLDYFGILLCNMLCVLGYALGYGIYWLGGEWQYIYIIGNLFSLIFIVRKYGISGAMFAKTVSFLSTAEKFGALTIAAVLNRALQYVDRLLLYPMLGGEEVTIYYVATLIGKTISMALAPLNSFLLSQLSKKKDMSKRIFWQILVITFITGIMAYPVCLILAKPLLGLLYPQWIEQSMKYIWITTLTAIISAISMVIAPMVLKFCNINWQILIYGTCFVVYVAASFILQKQFGLMGFCFGGMLANGISLCLMVAIYMFTYRKGRKTCVE